jgi:hypothetical protein
VRGAALLGLEPVSFGFNHSVHILELNLTSQPLGVYDRADLPNLLSFGGPTIAIFLCHKSFARARFPPECLL